MKSKQWYHDIQKVDRLILTVYQGYHMPRVSGIA